MAWTAEVVGKQFDLGQLQVAVRYSDGTKTKDELINVADGNLTTLKRRVQRAIDALTANEVLNRDVPLGPFDPTPPAEPGPTAQEIAFNTWMRKWRRLQAVNQLIAATVLTGNEPAVVSLRDDVKATFLPAYVNMI